MDGSAKYSGRGRATEDDEVGREPLDKALALSASVGCVGARGDNGSGSSDLSSGSEKLVKVLLRGSSPGGGARDLGTLLELISEVSCGRGDVSAMGVEFIGCAG